MSGIIGGFRSVQLFSDLFVKDSTSLYTPRVYQLRHGDVVFIDAVSFEDCFKMKIKDIKLHKPQPQFDPNFICIEKVKRKKWWQFWKQKYISVKLMYVGNNLEVSE